MGNRIITKLAAGAVVGGAALAGITVGAAPAHAQIDPGHYVDQGLVYGFIPSPESNVNVVGNQFQSDYYGLGPQNLSTQVITPTPDGGNVALGADPLTQWWAHDEVHKTPTGYYGTIYTMGEIPVGNIVMTRTPRLANHPR